MCRLRGRVGVRERGRVRVRATGSSAVSRRVLMPRDVEDDSDRDDDGQPDDLAELVLQPLMGEAECVEVGNSSIAANDTMVSDGRAGPGFGLRWVTSWFGHAGGPACRAGRRRFRGCHPYLRRPRPCAACAERLPWPGWPRLPARCRGQVVCVRYHWSALARVNMASGCSMELRCRFCSFAALFYFQIRAYYYQPGLDWRPVCRKSLGT
jgi:hypothetical protein